MAQIRRPVWLLPNGAGIQEMADGERMPGPILRPAVRQESGGTYTLAAADQHTILGLSDGSGVTLTLPSDSAASIPVGAVFTLWQAGAGGVELVPGSGATLTSSAANDKTDSQGAVFHVVKVAPNSWLAWGELVP
jgi:hypothetical protein